MSELTSRQRRDHVFAEVKRLFLRRKIEELAACIERGPGFWNDEGRSELASRVRWWVRDHLPHEHNERRPDAYNWVLMENGAKSARDEMGKLQEMA